MSAAARVVGVARRLTPVVGVIHHCCCSSVGARRCVDENILVRIDQYFLPLNETTKDAMFANFVTSRQKTLTFW